MNRAWMIPGLLSLLACGSAPPNAAPPTAPKQAPSHTFDPCSGDGVEGATVDCSTWRTWTKLNTEPFVSDGHQRTMVDLYVQPEFVVAYNDRSGPAPVGMRVVKAQYGKSGEVQALTVMGKMAPGYDPTNGDWFYGIYDPTGTKATKQGKLGMCIECHDQASDHDYLFGMPAL